MLTLRLDIQPKNILLGVLDDSAFIRFERDERESPMPRKELNSRVVYVSRPMPLTKGAPSLCDLSEARFGRQENADLVMPELYRAPEVVLGMPWSYSIDVWGLAMTVCENPLPRLLLKPRSYCVVTLILLSSYGTFLSRNDCSLHMTKIDATPSISTWHRWCLSWVLLR